MKGRPGDRRPDGQHALLLLRHGSNRRPFPYGKRLLHPRPVYRQHPAWPPLHDLRLHSLPRHRGPCQAPHPGHPHPASPPHCQPEGPPRCSLPALPGRNSPPTPHPLWLFPGKSAKLFDFLLFSLEIVGLSMMCYTLGKAERTCRGERQARGLIGNLLY